MGGRWRRADRSRRCGHARCGKPERARERTLSLVTDRRPRAALRSPLEAVRYLATTERVLLVGVSSHAFLS